MYKLILGKMFSVNNKCFLYFWSLRTEQYIVKGCERVINIVILDYLLFNHPYRINKSFSLEQLLYFR